MLRVYVLYLLVRLTYAGLLRMLFKYDVYNTEESCFVTVMKESSMRVDLLYSGVSMPYVLFVVQISLFNV